MNKEPDNISKIAQELMINVGLIYELGLTHGGNDALEYAAKLAEVDGKPTKLSEEIRSLKK